MRRHPLTALTCTFFAGVATACPSGSKTSPGYDADFDYYDDTVDCDDNNPYVHPGATEDCYNGIDDNCDGIVDGCFTDNDLDGYEPPEDCDDYSDQINPGMPEDCSNGYDDNCDGISTDCVDPALIYQPTSAGNYDAHGVAVYADYLVFGDPGSGQGLIGDGRAVFFDFGSGTVVSELDAELLSEGVVGSDSAYGTVMGPVGADLCISADYHDEGVETSVGKTWCYTEATIRGASGTLALADAAYTVTGESSDDYATLEHQVDADGDGFLDLLTYTSRGVQLIYGDGTPWSGDYSVPSQADLSVGNCASSATGWCGFAHAFSTDSSTLFVSDEDGLSDTISIYDSPILSNTTSATAVVSRQRPDSATAVEFIGGAAFGDRQTQTLHFIDAAGASAGSIYDPAGTEFAAWSANFVDQNGHELLLVADPSGLPPAGTSTGFGLVYVFDLDAYGLPSAAEQARWILVPPDNFFNCGLRARGGIVSDVDGSYSTVVLSCPGFGGAAYKLDYTPPPPPPLANADIQQTGPASYEIREWVIEAYSSRLEWIYMLGATEAVENSEGEIVGWRLSGVDQGSPLHRAGLRSGDILRRVNGVTLSNADVVTQLFTNLQEAEGLSLGLTRKGQNGQISYTFVP